MKPAASDARGFDRSRDGNGDDQPLLQRFVEVPLEGVVSSRDCLSRVSLGKHVLVHPPDHGGGHLVDGHVIDEAQDEVGLALVLCAGCRLDEA